MIRRLAVSLRYQAEADFPFLIVPPPTPYGRDVKHGHFDAMATTQPNGYAEPDRSSMRPKRILTFATEFATAPKVAQGCGKPLWAFHFAPDICNMPSLLFTGLPPTVQNLPFLQRRLVHMDVKRATRGLTLEEPWPGRSLCRQNYTNGFTTVGPFLIMAPGRSSEYSVFTPQSMQAAMIIASQNEIPSFSCSGWA